MYRPLRLVVQAYNPSTCKAQARGHEFEVNLSCIGRKALFPKEKIYKAALTQGHTETGSSARLGPETVIFQFLVSSVPSPVLGAAEHWGLLCMYLNPHRTAVSIPIIADES